MQMAWLCALFILAAAAATNLHGVEGLGVNWGTQAAQYMHPKTIVQLLKDNRINKIKLFESDPWVVKYFANTGIDVMLGIPNNLLARLANSRGNAEDWVKENLTKAYDNGVKISYVAVGNEPFLKSYKGVNLETTFPALKNIQRAVNKAGLRGKVKVTIPQNGDVYETTTSLPSGGQFRSDIKQLMANIAQFLHQNNSPFLVNIYPFLSLYENPDFPEDFAFFGGGAEPVQDNDVSYRNMFDANLDTLVWSLKKAGISQPNIVVGEIGWPTDGNDKATVKLAHKFYQGFLKKMASDNGTPLYRKQIEYYLFSLTDENQKSVAPGDFERHWGILTYDGKPKFPINFRGNGNEQMPVAAKGVKYMEKKWCILNSDVKIKKAIEASVQYACSQADCTAMQHNSSCGAMSKENKASYALNSYYQMQNQDVRVCNLDGKAKLVETNASRDGCLFPIALERAGGRKLEFHVAANYVVVALTLLFIAFA